MDTLKKVYLAGGMKSGWQDQVKSIYFKKTSAESGPFVHPKHKLNCVFFDPRDNNTRVAQIFTNWDLFYLRQADIVFAYLEADNPSGLGLAAEIGYAKALGQTIIFVNEQTDNRYVKFVEQISDVVLDNIEEGMVCLARLIGSDHSKRDVYAGKNNLTN